MAQDITQDFAAGPSVTGLFGSNITAGNSQQSSAIDFGTPAPFAQNVELVLATGTGTPDLNKQAVISIAWSNDNTDFSDSTNETTIDTVAIDGASSTFKKIFRFLVVARYAKIRILNDQTSGPDITTSSTIALTDVAVDQA